MKNKFIQIASFFIMLFMLVGCASSKEDSYQNDTEKEFYEGKYVSDHYGILTYISINK